MDRVFLDANVIFSAAYRPGSRLKQFWRLSRAGKTTLLTSAYAVEEARRNLVGTAQLFELDELLRVVEVSATPPVPESEAKLGFLPNKDKPIMQAAIAMKATHLITGDFSHFGSLYGKKIEGVLILTPAQYLKR